MKRITLCTLYCSLIVFSAGAVTKPVDFMLEVPENVLCNMFNHYMPSGFSQKTDLIVFQRLQNPVPQNRQPVVLQDQTQDPEAENMLVYQRSNGGWPKAVNLIPVNYKTSLSAAEKLQIRADSLKEDATIDNEATSREIKYLVKSYAVTHNQRYLQAAEKGIEYLFKAQYENGGWPQFYPDHHLYRGQITYNDNAMINVLNIMQDITEGVNGFELMDKFKNRAVVAVQKGIDCILKTQLLWKGNLSVWCAQYDEHTLRPAKARAFELISFSGSESVGVTEFLMRINNPSPAIRKAVHGAINWFEESKITDYDFVLKADPSLPKGKDKVVVKAPGSTIWARFYDLDTNKPFFSGRDSEKKNTVAEIEPERRTGYAWYGTWPAKLLSKKYPEWLKRTGG